MRSLAPMAPRGRGTLENTFLLALSQGIRLISGLVLFVVLARLWGPETFGTFMAPFVLTSLITLAIDYGFGLQLVRDIGECQERAAELTGRALHAKLILASVVVALAASVASLYLTTPSQWGLYGLLLGANVSLSFAQFFYLPLRAIDHLATETRLSLAGSILVFAMVLPAVLLGAGPILAAVAFMAARLIHVALAGHVCRQALSGPWPAFGWREAAATLSSGLPFGVHLVLGALYFQIDTLIIQHLLGQKEVGVYQAGFRLLAGAQILAEALGNAYLPQMARCSDREELLGMTAAFFRQAATVGLVGFVLLSAGAPWLVAFLYGDEYQTLAGLLPFFGVVLAIRYVGSAWGMLLTVCGRQMVRMASVAIALVASVEFNLALIPDLGLKGAVWASILTHLVLNGIYVGWLWFETRSLALSWRSLTLAAIGLAYGLLYWLMPLPPQAIVTFGVVTVAMTLLAGVEGHEWHSLRLKLTAKLLPSVAAERAGPLELGGRK